ncbi:MAG: cupin domain-containing protein [Synergistaceae bacterium]|nr:cupin domain-containing protein [Synergistaceae bacterium]
MMSSIFPKGEKASSELFTGTAFVNMLIADQNALYNTTVYDVLFEASARNNWHSHPQGQLLLCTSGIGYYQEKGQHARRLVRGDVVEIPADAVHWHGAAPDSDFSHIGITPNISKGAAVWFEPVSDDEYTEATKQGETPCGCLADFPISVL